jgi:hypothetical protein
MAGSGRTCVVCDRADELVHCANPRCRNSVCARHVLRFETPGLDGVTVDVFCSRRCHVEVLRRELPVRVEVLIGLIIVLVGLMVYALVVQQFV